MNKGKESAEKRVSEKDLKNIQKSWYYRDYLAPYLGNCITIDVPSYQDAVDRIEVERGFSLAKRNFGLGCIWTKLDSTTRSSIALSIVAMNLHRLTAISFCQYIKWLFFQITNLFSDRKAITLSIAQPAFC